MSKLNKWQKHAPQQSMRWEFFPMSFYTTSFDYRNFNLPMGWKERFVIPVIEKDIKKTSQYNPDWQCDVITNFHKKPNCLDRFRGAYRAIIFEYFKSLRWNPDVKYKMEMGKLWYNVYPPYKEGVRPSSQETHVHFPDHFSFVHYLEFDPEVHEPTVFRNPHLYSQMFDPNQFGDRMFEDIKTFETKEDDIVCFPSCIPHYVPRNMSNKRRITVAFNVRIHSKRI